MSSILLSMILGLSFYACSKAPTPPPFHSEKPELDADAAPSNVGDEENSGDEVPEPVSPTPTLGPVSPTPGPSPVAVTPTQTPAPTPVSTPAAVISSDGDGRFDKWKTVEEYKDRNITLPSFNMKFSDSKIYPKGNGGAPNKNQKEERLIQVYLPPNMDKTKAYPFMIIMDDWWKEPILSSMDKLIAEKKIPAMIGVFVANGGGDYKENQRGLEYDTVSRTNAEFFVQEVMPEVEKRYGVKLTKDPEGGGLFGGSSSGIAAFTAAWFMPERFRKVLAYSPTFVNNGPTTEYPGGGTEFASHLIAETPIKPIRVSMEVGTKDNGGWLEANIKTFEALKAKGYHVRFYVADGGGHVDGGVMKATMGDNLVWLWRDYAK